MDVSGNTTAVANLCVDHAHHKDLSRPNLDVYWNPSVYTLQHVQCQPPTAELQLGGYLLLRLVCGGWNLRTIVFFVAICDRMRAAMQCVDRNIIRIPQFIYFTKINNPIGNSLTLYTL